MNIEYVEGSDINELIKKIDINYKECEKYDIFIEENNIDEEKESFNNLKFRKKKNDIKNFETKNLNNNHDDKNEIKKGIDNIKNIIFQKKINDKNKKYVNFKKVNNKNVLTNLNVRKKRILESSDDESDENEFSSSVKTIVDYVKKRKNQRKK
ncbi:conserved Plasmodium protein, unknown function [Plasmodium gallinaceum]|uniref:Uncharacterized protein n=1 Tax=Plasmodium gallinaceum TaxID=5849 RepID=A0A1J1GXF4_PLAGA|nr:conserved Plasmodium protein, unknown function [Plasmodium gallinaceum]CRG95973.1 conserved Plasmodium protein, unknown function [Plasmodium gallinaceum]